MVTGMIVYKKFETKKSGNSQSDLDYIEYNNSAIVTKIQFN